MPKLRRAARNSTRLFGKIHMAHRSSLQQSHFVYNSTVVTCLNDINTVQHTLRNIILFVSVCFGVSKKPSEVQTCNKHFILSPGVIIPVVKTPATIPALNICRLLKAIKYISI